MQPDRNSDNAADRRKEKRLPEELLAVITDNAVAASLIDNLPEDTKQAEASWVAAGAGRKDRARRAVEVVRHAITARSEEHQDPPA